MVVFTRSLQFSGGKHNVPRGASMLVYPFFFTHVGSWIKPGVGLGGYRTNAREHHGSFQGVHELEHDGGVFSSGQSPMLPPKEPRRYLWNHRGLVGERESHGASSILSLPRAAEIQAAVQAASRLVNSLAEHENRRREHHGGSCPPSGL